MAAMTVARAVHPPITAEREETAVSVVVEDWSLPFASRSFDSGVSSTEELFRLAARVSHRYH